MSSLREAEQLLASKDAGGTVDQAGLDYQWLGRAALSLGRIDDARRLGDLALRNCPMHPAFAAHALHLQGDVAALPLHFERRRAEAYYGKARALAEAHGMQPVIAHCHLGLGRLYLRAGERAQEHRQLAAAASLYRDMGMRFYLEQLSA